MSLILEALRKSEAERQRGRAPGLFVEQAPARTRRSGTVPAWAWGLGLGLLALLALFAWREWERASAPPPTASAVAPGQESTPYSARSSAPAATGSSADQGAVSAPMPTPPMATATSPAPPGPGPTSAGPQPPSPASLPTPAPATATLPALAPSTTATAAPPPSPTLAAPAEEAVPTLSSLGAAERAQLPPLRLSMHVYAQDPAQRFVILDGQRLGEGASPAPGLVLEQIRRDGLVLSVDGQRLLLPRP